MWIILAVFNSETRKSATLLSGEAPGRRSLPEMSGEHCGRRPPFPSKCFLTQSFGYLDFTTSTEPSLASNDESEALERLLNHQSQTKLCVIETCCSHLCKEAMDACNESFCWAKYAVSTTIFPALTYCTRQTRDVNDAGKARTCSARQCGDRPLVPRWKCPARKLENFPAGSTEHHEASRCCFPKTDQHGSWIWGFKCPHFPSPRPHPQHRDAIRAWAPSWEVKLSQTGLNLGFVSQS